MNALQSLLDEHLAHHPVQLAVDILDGKLGEKGVTLTSRQKRKLQSALNKGQEDSLILRGGRPWQRGKVVIDITDADLAELEGRIEAWLAEAVPRLLESLASEIAGDLLKSLGHRWPAQRRHERKQEREFTKRLGDRWNKPLSLLRMLVTISTDFGALTVERLQQDNSVSELTNAQCRLHARGCQVAREVLSLLQDGFADGAMARWRTLHELAVVAMVLTEGGDSLAERYRLHGAVESRRAAAEYVEHVQRLGLEPLDPADISELDRTHMQLLQRFGKTLAEPYGWASDHVGRPRPTFADIERAAAVDHLRPYYRMASHNLHANPKGTFFRLGILGELDMMLAGASNYGLADPGQSTAISLVHVNVALAMSSLTFDGLVMMKLALQLSDAIAESFVSVQQQVEGEELAQRDA